MTRLVNLSLIYSTSAAAISLGCAAIAQTPAAEPVSAAAPAAEDAKAAAKAAKAAAAAEAKKQRELAQAIKRARFLGLLPYVIK